MTRLIALLLFIAGCGANVDYPPPAGRILGKQDAGADEDAGEEPPPPAKNALPPRRSKIMYLGN